MEEMQGWLELVAPLALEEMVELALLEVRVVMVLLEEVVLLEDMFM